MENFRINNEYLDQYEALTSEMEEQPAAGSDRVHSMVEHVARRMRFAPRVADVERWMIRHAAILKDIEKNLKTEVAALRGGLGSRRDIVKLHVRHRPKTLGFLPYDAARRFTFSAARQGERQ